MSSLLCLSGKIWAWDSISDRTARRKAGCHLPESGRWTALLARGLPQPSSPSRVLLLRDVTAGVQISLMAVSEEGASVFD